MAADSNLTLPKREARAPCNRRRSGPPVNEQTPVRTARLGSRGLVYSATPQREPPKRR